MLLTSGLDTNLEECPIPAIGGGSVPDPVQMSSLASLLGGRHLDVADPPYTGTQQAGLERDTHVTCQDCCWLKLNLYICSYIHRICDST